MIPKTLHGYIAYVWRIAKANPGVVLSKADVDRLETAHLADWCDYHKLTTDALCKRLRAMMDRRITAGVPIRSCIASPDTICVDAPPPEAVIFDGDYAWRATRPDGEWLTTTGWKRAADLSWKRSTRRRFVGARAMAHALNCDVYEFVQMRRSSDPAAHWVRYCPIAKAGVA